MMVDAAFDRLVRECWEAREALLPAAMLPAITSGELFAAVVACVDDFVAHRRQRVRFYVAGTEVALRGENLEALPCRDDRDFAGYHRRLAAGGLVDYALVVADWHQFDRDVWDRLVDFVARLTERVGLSQSRIDTQLFAGSYRVTPFGVHVDPVSAIHVPITGNKTMRFWPSSYVEAHPRLKRAAEYGAFLHDSAVVTATPGEVIYWPSDRWHVGESDGAFSAAWGLGYWVGRTIWRSAVEWAVAKVVDELETAQLPLAEAASLRPLQRVVDSLGQIAVSDELWLHASQIYLEHASAFGFVRPPAPVVVELGAIERLHRKRPFRLLACEPRGGRRVVAAAGYSRVVPDTDATRLAVLAFDRDDPVERSELAGADDIVELAATSGAFTAS